MIARLIALPSMSSVNPAFDTGNRAVIDQLAEWLDGMGFAVEVLPLPTQPNKANLIATLGSGPGGLVLAGHTDTVPYDEGRWNHDPFRMSEADNRLYGLGSADMKSFFALAIEAANSFVDKELKEPLIILASADEESSMDGARALVELGRPRARYAVVGEPTGMRPVNAHKGIIMEAIHLRGRSGHSSDPSLGLSALEGMHKVIGEIMRWRDELQRDFNDPSFKVPHPTLNLGHICGGDNPNRICGHCELHIDLRPVPGLEINELRHSLKNRLDRLLADSGLTNEVRPLFEGIPAMHTDAASEIVRVAERLTGHQAESVAYATEGPYYQQLGMQTIILGPGSIDQAHQADEYLGIGQLNICVETLSRLIENFCLE